MTRTAAVRRTFAQIAASNPCLVCGQAACCTYLLLARTRPRTFGDLDRLRRVIQFADIVLLAQPSGRWQILLHRACRRLDQAKALCTVRGDSRHPLTCRAYSPYDCWYRCTFASAASENHACVDADAFERLLPRFVFDEADRLVAWPAWRVVRAVVETKAGAASAPPDAPNDVPPAGGADFLPCSGCAAPCCDELSFPVPPLLDRARVEFCRYATGFPGVSFAWTDGASARLVVRGTCRHFGRESRRCRVHGTARRPKQCEFLNPWRCESRPGLSVGRRRSVRLDGPDAFDAFAAAIEYDEQGRVRRLPSAASLLAVPRAVGAASPKGR